MIDDIDRKDDYDLILTSFHRRDLSSNQLTSIPKEVGNLTSLRDLYVANSSLTTYPEGHCGPVHHLSPILTDAMRSLPRRLEDNFLESAPPEVSALKAYKGLKMQKPRSALPPDHPVHSFSTPTAQSLLLTPHLEAKEDGARINPALMDTYASQLLPSPSSPSPSSPSSIIPSSLTKIVPSDLVMVQKIGKGAFGEVWRAQWHGTDVAVKKLSGDANKGELLNEITIMQNASSASSIAVCSGGNSRRSLARDGASPEWHIAELHPESYSSDGLECGQAYGVGYSERHELFAS